MQAQHRVIKGLVLRAEQIDVASLGLFCVFSLPMLGKEDLFGVSR